MEGLVWLAILAAAAGVAVAPAFPVVRRFLGLTEDTPEAQAVRAFLKLRRSDKARQVIAKAKATGEAPTPSVRELHFAYPQQLPLRSGGAVLATDLDLLRRDRHLFASRGDTWGEASVLNLIGFIHERHGEFDQAAEMHQGALALFEEIKEPRGVGDSHNNLGVVFGRIGKSKEALAHHSQALKVRRASNDYMRISNSHNNFAVVLAGERAEEATNHLREAAELSEAAAEDPRGMGKIINNITVLEIESGCAEGRGEVLCERFTEALDLRSASEDQRGNAKTRNNLGIVHALRGDYESADEHFSEAATLAGSVEDHVGLLHILRNWRRLAQTRAGEPERLGELNERIADLERGEILKDTALKADCEAFILRCGGGNIAPGQVALLSSGSATPATAGELQGRLRESEAASEGYP